MYDGNRLADIKHAEISIEKNGKNEFDADIRAAENVSEIRSFIFKPGGSLEPLSCVNILNEGGKR